MAGRKRKVMIACVTFETVKVVDPIDYYSATEVHLIHWSDGRDDVYDDFYKEVCRQIDERFNGTQRDQSCERSVTIVEHNVKVSDFPLMFSTVLSIFRDEALARDEALRRGEKIQPTEFFVNISAGTSEYSAAATIASMMMNDDEMNDVTLFTVGSSVYQVQKEDVKALYYSDGRPVGLTKATKQPREVDTYTIERPDESLVFAFKIFVDRLDKGQSTSAKNILKSLEANGILKRRMDTKGSVKNPQQAMTMYYQRNYVNEWLSRGWLDKASKNEYSVTREGRAVIEIFYKGYSSGEMRLD